MSQAGQIIMGLALVAACTGAGAQTVYRCGSAYSQAPCTGGQGIDNPETPQTPRAWARSLLVYHEVKAASLYECQPPA